MNTSSAAHRWLVVQCLVQPYWDQLVAGPASGSFAHRRNSKALVQKSVVFSPIRTGEGLEWSACFQLFSESTGSVSARRPDFEAHFAAEPGAGHCVETWSASVVRHTRHGRFGSVQGAVPVAVAAPGTGGRR